MASDQARNATGDGAYPFGPLKTEFKTELNDLPVSPSVWPPQMFDPNPFAMQQYMAQQAYMNVGGAAFGMADWWSAQGIDEDIKVGLTAARKFQGP